jgi:hypothetical protein
VKAAAPAPIVAVQPAAVATDPSAPLDPAKMARLLPDAIPGGWVRAALTRNNGGMLGFTGPTVEAVYERGGQRLVVRVIDLGPGGAAASIAALRASTLGDVAAVHDERDGGYVFRHTDTRGVARWLTVAEDRVVVAAEGSGGVTQAGIAEALTLVDMVRVGQIARGL